MTIRSIGALSSALRAQKAYIAGQRPVDKEIRKDRLRRLQTLMRKHQRSFANAVNADFGSRHPIQTRMELLATVESAKHAEKNLSKWMKPSRQRLPLPLALTGACAKIHYQPLGSIGVVAPWNFPFNLSFGPIAGIFAAGNVAMLKLSELAPVSAEAISEAIDEYFSDDELVAVIGGVDIAQAFTALPFDHMIFTGSPAIGRHVMRSAADNLVPVTLELGGKCPAIVDKGYDLTKAAKRILVGKVQNAGQICLAPDTVFVHEHDLEDFIEATRAIVSDWFKSINENADYVSMINEPAFNRMQTYLEQARSSNTRIEFLGPESQPSETRRKIPLSFIVNPSQELSVSVDEIFGPLTVLRTYQDINEVISYLSPPRDLPLGLYYFSTDRLQLRKYAIAQ